MEERGINPQGLALLAAAAFYLTRAPGVLSGFIDTYLQAPMQARTAKVYGKVCAPLCVCKRRGIPGAVARWFSTALAGVGTLRAEASCVPLPACPLACPLTHAAAPARRRTLTWAARLPRAALARCTWLRWGRASSGGRSS